MSAVYRGIAERVAVSRGGAAGVGFVALLLASGPAFAQGAPLKTRLIYNRVLPGAESCPNEETFRDLVSARTKGADPFDENAPRRVTVTLERRGWTFRGAVAPVDNAGRSRGVRELSDPSCEIFSQAQMANYL